MEKVRKKRERGANGQPTKVKLSIFHLCDLLTLLPNNEWYNSKLQTTSNGPLNMFDSLVLISGQCNKEHRV